jgi:fructose-specific component phosphotransferase system IIB-like protein
MKGDITINKMTGLVYRDGKILGRKNWIVQVETALTAQDEFVVKAIDVEEAEAKAMDIAKGKYRRYGDGVYSEIVTCWSPD